MTEFEKTTILHKYCSEYPLCDDCAFLDDGFNCVMHTTSPEEVEKSYLYLLDHAPGYCERCQNQEIPEDKAMQNALSEIQEGAKKVAESAVKAAGTLTVELNSTPRILDSGNRREFESGAVRDICEGKGRCDLLPLDVVSICVLGNEKYSDAAMIFAYIADFVNDGDWTDLSSALGYFQMHQTEWNVPTMLLEVSKHFEEGCKKYGDNNWQKGIPVRCYIDSAVRHYLKYLRGDKDEPHDRAFCWNILCCIWTCKHKPELNDYAKREEKR